MARLRLAGLGLALAAALPLATAAAAQSAPTQIARFMVTGEVTAIDTAKQTVTVKGTGQAGGTYSIDKGTTIMSGNQRIDLDELELGSRVALNAEKNVATHIEVVEGPVRKK